MMVTISPRTFRFNSACYPNIVNKKFCEIYIDRKNKIIAFRPLHIESPSSFLICKGGSGDRNWVICASDFISKELYESLKFLKEERSYAAQIEWDVKNKIFILDIKPLIETINLLFKQKLKNKNKEVSKKEENEDG